MLVKIVLGLLVIGGGRLLLKRMRSKPIKRLEYLVSYPIYKKQHIQISIFMIASCVDTRLYVGILFGYCMPIYSAKRTEKKLKRRLRYEFSIWLRNLSVYLKYNTVYHALIKTYHLTPLLFREDVDTLMEGIRNDPQNRKVYLGFMTRYDHYDIQYMMKQLYRYASESNEDAQSQLIRMVGNANSFIKKSRVQSYISLIDSKHWLGFMPLVMVSFVFMALMFVLIGQVLGGGWIA